VQLRNNHGIKFKITTGVMFIEQDATELEKFREIIKRIDDYELTAYYAMATVTGSITIGLNLFENNLTIDEAWNAGHLDENFQVSQWGEDDEAAQRRQNLKNELINTTQFLALCRN
jgi:chaperone required for assembly of F1-ATPase